MQICIRVINGMSRVMEKLGIFDFNTFLFLALLGVITALIAFIVDVIAYNVIDCKFN